MSDDIAGLVERLRQSADLLQREIVSGRAALGMWHIETVLAAASALEAMQQDIVNFRGALDFATNDPEGWQKALTPPDPGSPRITHEQLKALAAELYGTEKG